MSAMIELVARALCLEAGGAPDYNVPNSDGSPFYGWEYYKGAARAAIEAMRHPTGAMSASVEYDLDVETGWGKMIDAALAETPVANA